MHRRSRLRSLPPIAALLLFALATFAAGCQSNAEKIADFCTDFRAAAEQHENSCDQMGAALDEVFRKHEGMTTFGSVDDEASRQALDDCRAGARVIATRCADNAAVGEALQTLEAR